MGAAKVCLRHMATLLAGGGWFSAGLQGRRTPVFVVGFVTTICDYGCFIYGRLFFLFSSLLVPLPHGRCVPVIHHSKAPVNKSYE